MSTARKRKPKRITPLTSIEKLPVNNLVVVGDTHSGCKLALYPDAELHLDEGGEYKPSKFQKMLWEKWQEFWGEWVPDATRGEPYAVVHIGDALDGVHHGATTPISHNLNDQEEIAYTLMKPVVEMCEGRYYHIRGTEAHVGKEGSNEERLARRLGAIPNDEKQYARYDLWKEVGGELVNLLHHVGTVGSQAYESTALHREYTECLIECARWQRRAPSAIVRGHRHRHMLVTMPTGFGQAHSVVTPCWQGKTAYVWRCAGARLTTPQIGGILLRKAHGRFFVDTCVWSMPPSRVEE